MALVGYARASASDQDYEIQVKLLKKSGCKKIFKEKHTGTEKNRPEWDKCFDYLREGDVLVIHRIDRLGRSVRDLQNVVHELQAREIGLRVLDHHIDTTTAAGKAFFDMLTVFAEFEHSIRRERQLLGIKKAKNAGKYKGRKPTALAKQKELEYLKSTTDLTNQEIASELGIGIASVYRMLKLM